MSISFTPGGCLLPRTCFLLALTLVCATGTSAQTIAPSADALKPFEFLLGQWVAENEPGADKYIVERAWRREFGGKFLRTTEKLIAGGAEVFSEAWLGYDPARSAVAAWVFSSDGSYAVMDRVTVSGDSFVLEGRIFGGRSPGPVRATSKRSGNDHISETVEVQQDGAWVTRRVRNFVRRSAPMETPNRAADASPALKPLELLAGDWRAEGEADGVKFAADYAIHWLLGGHFLRSDYSVSTGSAPPEFHSAAYMFFDPESKSLRQIGFSAEGSVADMKIIPSASSVLFDGEMVTPTRRTPMRITYSRPDADTLTASTEMQRQGAWRRSGTGSFKRRPS